MRHSFYIISEYLVYSKSPHKTNMNTMYVFMFCCIVGVLGSPKKYLPEEGGFQPSQLRYYESQLPSSAPNVSEKQAKEAKESRFGISSFGNTGSGVQFGNSNGVGYGMTPMKIDIGGIALGALIGLGAILIVPKLAHVFSSGGYGYRSLENDMSSITDILARVDNSLEQHNIDSSSCMQRIICSYVHEAQNNMQKGEANTVDQLVYAISNNSLFSYLLDGSSIKQAIDMGKQTDLQKCAALYMKCPVSKENVMQIIGTLLPA
ncbi:PREDICTED: uncharacterized protein LOC108564947 [Nicrophorus vespilloides]|uniref:Uncharacterized protein LOC108564947 n=1 Tax=Nicrophorus vespilloides TaxID=110193 RepID=A0ABM1MYI9_NICVS|nr:PREDICTED: uncharacterized protein LOC108564947 [Nicrophorus vespilloides]